MRGKRAVELACGHLRTILEEMFTKNIAEVFEFCSGLAGVEFQSVMDGLSEAKSTLIALLMLKTQFWLTIPWKLAGMFHWNSGLAAECARECVDQWEQQPVDDQHHRVSVEFLSSGGKWRHQVDQLAQGVPLLRLSIPFIIRCVELGLIPVVERIMEQRHAFVHQRLRIGKKKKRSAATVSLGAGRMREIEGQLECDPAFPNKLIENMTKFRNPRAALTELNLTLHPRVALLLNIPQAAGQNELKHHTFLWPGLIDIVYRLSGDDQYQSTDVVTAANAKHMREVAKVQRKLGRKTKPPSHATREGCVSDLMRAHLIAECHTHGPGFQFSLCASYAPGSQFQACVASLEDHLQSGIGQKVPTGPLTTAQLPRSRLQADLALEEAFASDADVEDAAPDVDAAPEPASGIVTPQADPQGQDDYVQEVHFKVQSITY